MQYPLAIVSPLSVDLELSAFRRNQPIPGVIRKQTMRLHEFLQELLDHPLIGQDRTLMLFLESVQLDKTQITLDSQQSIREPAVGHGGANSGSEEDLHLTVLLDNIEQDRQLFKDARTFFMRMENCYAALAKLAQQQSLLHNRTRCRASL